ncbi:MAG: hypothetical protein HYY80_05205 [Chloroflexi bacterium]|nr:hypothetical protein [Chloroflexota bacterium]
MSKLRISHIASLVILGILLVFTVFRPIATGGKYSEVSREQLLQTEAEYIIQFDIINREGEAKKYTIKAVVDDYRYSEDVIIPDGRKFTYIHHIYPGRITAGNISFTIAKEGEDSPFEQITYHLK